MPTTPLEPATLDQDGKPPTTRFSSFAGLQSAYMDAKRMHDTQDIRYTSIRGIFDRMPPEDPAYLRQQGLEDMPNFNTGEFTAKVESYVSTWVDHNTGGYKFAKVRLKRKKENPPELSDAYDEKATDFFNEAMTEWEDDAETQSAAHYILKSCVRDTQMGLFGVGYCYFKDDVDWRFCSIPNRKVLLPRGTSVTLENCGVLFVESETTVTDLYNKVKSANADAGWNKDAVWQMLYDRTAENKAGTNVRESLAEWQNRLRDNDDSFLNMNFSLVEVVDCYVQEFNEGRKKNGISHYVIARSGAPMEILFKKERRYKSYRTFLIPFVDNSGPEGDIHGVKGFGDSIYDNCHFQNQFFNHMARTSLMANMPMWQTSGESDRDKVSQIKWTNLGILNPGVNLNPIRIHTDLNGMLAIHQASQRIVNTNSRTYPTGETMGQEAKTATQSTFDRQDQAKLSSLQIKMYRMVGLDSLLTEMYRRISRESYPGNLPGGRAAENFRKKCEEAGIPADCYSNPIKVEADRTGGTGNMALDLMIAEKALSVASPGRGQFNARKDIVKSLVGSDRVLEFVQPEDYVQEGQAYVDLENSNLADGQTFPARENQDHIIHLGVMSPEGSGHLAVLMSAFQTAQQMAEAGVEQFLEDAKKIDRVMEATVTHVVQHVAFLESIKIESYQEVAKEMRKLINDVAQFMITFRDQIAKAVQNQQPQGPQLSAADQAKIISAQVEAKIKEAQAMQDLQHKQQNQDMKVGNMAERSAVNNELKMAEQMAELQRKQVEFEQQLGQMALETMTQAEIDVAKTRAKANAEKAE